jgi:hypothetical protein
MGKKKYECKTGMIKINSKAHHVESQGLFHRNQYHLVSALVG